MNMFDVLLARRMNSAPLPQNAHLATVITSQPVTDASDYLLPKCDVTVTDADKCEVIVTDDGVIIEDNKPYNYRQSAGGDTELDELVGGTVAWNQLVKNGDFESTNGWQAIAGSSLATFSVEDKKATVTIVATGNSAGIYRPNSMNESVGNHVALFSGVFTASSDTNIACNIYNSTDAGSMPTITVPISANARTNATQIWRVGARTSVSGMYVYVNRSDKLTAGATVVVEDVQLHDLTLMFGSTIADYIYNLEQTTAGSGVTWLKEHFPKLFADGYKAYNAGDLVSVKATAHETVGFNQWDEQWEVGGINTADGTDVSGDNRIRTKNYIPILSGNDYYLHYGGSYTVGLRFYDIGKNYIGSDNITSSRILYYGGRYLPSDTAYLRFILIGTTTYNNDICINISDPSKNGTYEPYVKHSYPLSPVELRGLFKLDANNKLYCNGDSYRGDGQVKRRFGIVDLGTLVASTDTVGFAQLNLPGIKTMETSAEKANILCAKYVTDTQANVYAKTTDKTISGATTETVRIYGTAFIGLTSTQVRTALSGVYLVYELATPTEEYTSPFEKNQAVDAGGTEEYIDERDVSVPVGHSTKYFNGKAYTKYFDTKSGVVEMADEGIMPVTPMYISANGEIDAEYWR